MGRAAIMEAVAERESGLLYEEIPKLRRFGRIVTLSVRLTDQVLISVLHQLINDRHAAMCAREDRFHLYRVFLNELAKQERNAECVAQTRPTTEVEAFLATITSLQRKVVVLRFVEEFEREDVATLLRLDIAELEELETSLALRRWRSMTPARA